MHSFVVLAYKESPYLESCIRSVLNQSMKSKVVLATSTPNGYISGLAQKYGLELFVRKDPKCGIGYDFEFALHCADTKLVTIAHQDDIYDYDYAFNICYAFQKNPDALILFSDYYELRNAQIERKNLNLRIKKFLLFPLRSRLLRRTKFGKRCSLRLGCAICCPSVAFVMDQIRSAPVFRPELLVSLDWDAWERLSLKKGSFVYIPKQLMGHRIHSGSETTARIRDNTRYQEDLLMFQRFWSLPLAKGIAKAYSASEKSNG